MSGKKTLIIGASTYPHRYSYKAAHRLTEQNHPILMIGKSGGELLGQNIEREKIQWDDIHTVTMYINPSHQPQHYDYIIGLKPKRIIFNPGTENREFEKLAEENDIEVLERCTLIMLSVGDYRKLAALVSQILYASLFSQRLCGLYKTKHIKPCPKITNPKTPKTSSPISSWKMWIRSLIF